MAFRQLILRNRVTSGGKEDLEDLLRLQPAEVAGAETTRRALHQERSEQT
jgi:hypothetical protein